MFSKFPLPSTSLLESLGLSEDGGTTYGSGAGDDNINYFPNPAPGFGTDLNPFSLEYMMSMTGTVDDSNFGFA